MRVKLKMIRLSQVHNCLINGRFAQNYKKIHFENYKKAAHHLVSTGYSSALFL